MDGRRGNGANNTKGVRTGDQTTAKSTRQAKELKELRKEATCSSSKGSCKCGGYQHRQGQGTSNTSATSRSECKERKEAGNESASGKRTQGRRATTR